MSENVLRGLDVLTALAGQPEPVSARELIAATGLGRATVYRTLQVLCDAGWVLARGNPRRFTVSLRVSSLGLRALAQNHVRTAVLPISLELARASGFTCSIAFYEEGDAVYTDGIEVMGERVVSMPRDRRLPALQSASGRILLAFQDDAEIARVVAAGKHSLSEFGFKDEAHARREILAARERGYGIWTRQGSAWVTGLALPVFDRQNRIAAALAMIDREPFRSNFVESMLGIARLHAARASFDLGYTPLLGSAL